MVVLKRKLLQEEIFVCHELDSDGFQMIDELRIMTDFQIVRQFVAG